MGDCSLLKHSERFPEEGLANTIRNVFDFDAYDDDSKNLIIKTLTRHGIPLNSNLTVSLGKM